MKKSIIFLLCGMLCLVMVCGAMSNKAGVCYVDGTTNVMALAPNVGSYARLVTVLSQSPNIRKVAVWAGNLYVKNKEGFRETLVATDEGYVLLFFDDDGEYLYHKVIALSSASCKEKMDQITEGTPYTEIYAIDPEGDFQFLYTSWSHAPNISYHYFSDGTGYLVTYDENLNVTNVSVFII